MGCDSQQKKQTQQSTVQQQSAVPEATEPVTPPRAEDWHMFMHNLGFSGVSPDKDITPPLELLWKFKTGGPAPRFTRDCERHFVYRIDRWQVVCLGCKAVGYQVGF